MIVIDIYEKFAEGVLPLECSIGPFSRDVHDI